MRSNDKKTVKLIAFFYFSPMLRVGVSYDLEKGIRMGNWISRELMISIDLVLIAIGISAMIFIHKYRHVFKQYSLTKTVNVILSGLWVIVSIYVLNFVSMTVLPLFIGGQESHLVMESLHQKYAWSLNLIGLSCIGFGFYFLMLKFITTLSNLEVTKQELTGAIKTKEQFLAKMSHELRTPLNAIIGFSAILNKQSTDMITGKIPGHVNNQDKRIPSDENIMNYSHYILESGTQLLSLIEHLLQVSNPREQLYNPEIGPVDLGPIIDDTIMMMSTAAREKNIEIKNTLPKVIPPVFGNEMTLCQIFLNLLNNAISFSDENSTIEITGSMDKNSFYCHINDCGIGIEEKNLQRIQKPFEQVNDGVGLGLGLPVCNKFIGKLGGSLVINSQLGVGTKVTVGLIRVLLPNVVPYTPLDRTLH